MTDEVPDRSRRLPRGLRDLADVHRLAVWGERAARQAAAVKRPGPRGWFGRGRGESSVIQPVDEWRGTTVQVCGLFPFAVGSGTPMVGVPLGRHLFTNATVCADPISWFQIAKLISNPSVFVLGLPGLGKSTLVRRMALGLSGFGVQPLVLGDLKPDYVDLIDALGSPAGPQAQSVL